VKPFDLKAIALLGVLLAQACSSKPPLHHEDLLYSAVGTSGILGVGAFPLSDGYTFRIQSAFRDRGRNVSMVQIGVPGANTDIVSDAVAKAADKGLEAEFATVWVGANDLVSGVPVETFAAELKALLGVLQNDMDAYVVIANLPPMHNFPNFIEEPVPEVTEQRVTQFNAVITAQAVEFGMPVVDLADDALGARLVVDFDGLHPDDEGHERLAKLFMNAIRPVL
jgi:lysophospholipase L1-like esterase